MEIQLTKTYGVVQFEGTLQHPYNHTLVFESDDPIEAMSHLEELCATLGAQQGCALVFQDHPSVTEAAGRD